MISRNFILKKEMSTSKISPRINIHKLHGSFGDNLNRFVELIQANLDDEMTPEFCQLLRDRATKVFGNYYKTQVELAEQLKVEQLNARKLAKQATKEADKVAKHEALIKAVLKFYEFVNEP